MRQSPRPNHSEKRRAPRPIGAGRLEEMALAYVARFATSAAKLEAYLRRKLRTCGWDGEGEPPIAALVERFVAAGYLDDEAYARTKSGSLLRRGYGRRRIGQALQAAGIAEDLRGAVAPDLAAQRMAALACARKRRLGPYGPGPGDRTAREKQIAALLRAGHPLDMARELVDAASISAAEEWAAQEEEY